MIEYWLQLNYSALRVLKDMRFTQLVLFFALVLVVVDVHGARERPWCEKGSALCQSGSSEARYEHRTVAAGNGLIYTFGGRKGMKSSDIATADSIEEMQPKSRVVRSQLLTNSEEVTGRSGHTMVEWVDATGRRHLVVFGGAAYSANAGVEELLSNVASLNLQTFTWSAHSSAGEGPQPRRHASAAVWRDVMLVYGGELATSESYSSELWAYNLTARRWMGLISSTTTSAQIPALRSAAMAVSGDVLLLYGGFTQNTQSVLVPSPPPPIPSLPLAVDQGCRNNPGPSTESDPGASGSSSNSPPPNSDSSSPPSLSGKQLNSPPLPYPSEAGSGAPPTAASSAYNSPPSMPSVLSSGSAPPSPRPMTIANSPLPQAPSISGGAPPPLQTVKPAANYAPPPTPSSPRETPMLPPVTMGAVTAVYPSSVPFSNPISVADPSPVSSTSRRSTILESATLKAPPPFPDPIPSPPDVPPPPPPLPPSPPPPAYMNVTRFRLSHSLWAVDLRDILFDNSAPVTWVQAKVEAVAVGAQGAPLFMPGLDSFLQFSGSGSALIIYISGGLTRYGNLAQPGWLQWYGRYEVSNISSALEGLAADISSSKAAGGDIVPSLSLTVKRTGMFMHRDLLNKASSTSWVNLDQTTVELASADLSGIGELPQGLSPSFVFSQTWAEWPDGSLLVYGGARQAEYALLYTGYSRRMLLTWSTRVALQLDDATLKHSYFETSTSYTVMRSMHSVVLPTVNSTDTHTGLIFFGKYDVSKREAPDVTTLILSNATAFTTVASCCAACLDCFTQSMDTLAFASSARDGYVSTSLRTTYRGKPYGADSEFAVETPLVLVYGGMQTTGGPIPERGVDLSNTGAASILTSALKGCGTSGLMAAAELYSYATCVVTKLSSQTYSSSSEKCLLSASSPVGRRRRLLSGQELTADTDTAAAAQEAWGPSRRSASNALDPTHGKYSRTAPRHRAGRRALLVNNQVVDTYYDTATALVWQNPEAKPMTIRASGTSSFFYGAVLNVQGGSSHSPGPRVGASMSSVSNRGVLLFGGATLNHTAAMLNDGIISTDELVLACDVHYLHLYVGGETVEPSSVVSCPAGASCNSAADFPWTPQQEGVPRVAPLLAPSMTDLPATAESFSCGNRTVRVDVMVSQNTIGRVSSGFLITTWSGEVLLKVANLVDVVKSASKAAGGGGPGGGGGGTSPSSLVSAITCGYLELPTGLIQVWLTSQDGYGWTRDEDVFGRGSSSSVMGLLGLCCTSQDTSCCPQLRLYSEACGGETAGGYVPGFGIGQALFDVGTANRRNSSFYQYRTVYGLVVQPTDATLPTGDNATYVQFPLMQRGNHLYTFEVMPLASESRLLPKGRHRHATAFVNASGIHAMYGTKGVLVLYGGSTTYSIDNPGTRLSDLWVFCLSNNSWIELQPEGSGPPALINHAMAAVDTQVFIGGGEHYDIESRTFQQDAVIYQLDLGLPTLMWRKVAGGSDNIFKTTLPTIGHYSLSYLPEFKQLAFSTPKDLYLVPVTIRNSLTTANTSTPSSASSATGGTGSQQPASISGRMLSPMLSTLYDGDTLLLTDFELVVVPDDSQALLVDAAILIQGRFTAVDDNVQPSRRILAQLGYQLPSGCTRQRFNARGGNTHSPQQLSGVGDSRRPHHHQGRLPSPKGTQAHRNLGGATFRVSLGAAGYAMLRPAAAAAAAAGTPAPERQPTSDGEQYDSSRHPHGTASSADSIIIPGDERRRLEASSTGIPSLPPQPHRPPPPSSPAPPGPPYTVSTETLLARYLDGLMLTVVDCQGSSSAMTITSGGATFQNLLFRGCTNTSVIVNTASSEPVTFSNCLFYGNTGTHGGAMRVSSESSVVLVDCIFLSNNATQGGAVFVEQGGYLNADGVVFVRNGNGPLQEAGGAVYGAAGSCVASFSSCLFDSNGNISVSSGGAVALDAPSCIMAASDSVFTGNRAVSGGAVSVASTGSDVTTNFEYCHFTNNNAASKGGALMLQEMYGDVVFRSCRFEGNWATYRGGAIQSSSVHRVLADNSTFQGNLALSGTGGAWCAEKEGEISLNGTVMVGNQAKYGGGLSLKRDLSLIATLVEMSSNVATQHAGALEAVDCALVNIDSCRLTNNTALSAGALSLIRVTQGVNITDTTFTSNTAASFTVSSDPCGRSSSNVGGGGGALCVEVAGNVTLTGTTFTNNMATNGGAIWAAQKCSVLEEDCGYVVMEESSLVGNQAAGGGGGALFVYEAADLNVSCSTAHESLNKSHVGVISLASMTAAEATAYGGCSSATWSNNTALYGNNIATTAASLRIVSPERASLASYRSNDLISLQAEVLDAFGQRVAGGSPEALGIFNAGPNSTQPLGVLSQSASAGIANFTSLRVRETPGNYTFNISMYGSYHDLQPVVISVEVRCCVLGEVTNSDNDLCLPCGPGTFSFNPANTSCDTCPENAQCATDLTSGFIMLPKPGYWRSGPFSPQIIECPNTDACSYDGVDTTASISSVAGKSRPEALLAALKDLAGGGGAVEGREHFVAKASDDDVASWQRLQCSEGYWGNACGGCQPGYGRTGEAQCSTCPNRSLNALYFILVSLVNVAIIAITIRTQLVRNWSDNGHAPLQAKNPPLDSEAADVINTTCTAQPAGCGISSCDSATPCPNKGTWGELTKSTAAAPPGGVQLRQKCGWPVAGAISGDDEGTRPLKSASDAGMPCKQDGLLMMVNRSGSDAASASRSGGQQQKIERDAAAKAAVRAGGGGDYMMEQELMAGTPAIVIKILVSYLQVVSIVKDVAVMWPSPVERLLNLGSQISSGISTMVSFDCLLPETGAPKSIARVVVNVLTPLLLMLLAVPVWLLIYAVQVKRQRRTAGATPLDWRKYLKIRLIMTIITIGFFTYPAITNALLSIFACPVLDKHVQGGTPYSDQLQAVGRYWSSDYNVKCYVGQHRLLMLILGVPGVLLFSCGVPAFAAWFLHLNARKLRKRTFYRAYGFLYSDYEDAWYAWESVVMLRKLAKVQLLVSLGVVLAALAVQLVYNPYRCPRMDSLERVSLFGTTTLIYVALFFMLDMGDTLAMLLTVTLLILNSLILTWFGVVMLREVARTIMRELDTGRDGVVESEDVMAYVESLQTRKPWLANRVLRFHNWARGRPRVRRFLSHAYPYGEATDPWINSGMYIQRDSDEVNEVLQPPLPEEEAGDSAAGDSGDAAGDDDDIDSADASQQPAQLHLLVPPPPPPPPSSKSQQSEALLPPATTPFASNTVAAGAGAGAGAAGVSMDWGSMSSGFRIRGSSSVRSLAHRPSTEAPPAAAVKNSSTPETRNTAELVRSKDSARTPIMTPRGALLYPTGLHRVEESDQPTMILFDERSPSGDSSCQRATWDMASRALSKDRNGGPSRVHPEPAKAWSALTAAELRLSLTSGWGGGSSRPESAFSYVSSGRGGGGSRPGSSGPGGQRSTTAWGPLAGGSSRDIDLQQQDTAASAGSRSANAPNN